MFSFRISFRITFSGICAKYTGDSKAIILSHPFLQKVWGIFLPFALSVPDAVKKLDVVIGVFIFKEVRMTNNVISAQSPK